MSTSPYSGPQMDSSLGGSICSSGPPNSSSYSAQDRTPYSSLPPFSYTDRNLLTPVSSAASPLLQHKLRVEVSESSEETQQPTPPGSSKMYYGYDLGNSSQSSSPLTIDLQLTESHFDMNYINASSSEPEVVPYFGSYSVSEGPESTERDGSIHRYHDFPHQMGTDAGNSAAADRGLAMPPHLQVSDQQQQQQQLYSQHRSMGPMVPTPESSSLVLSARPQFRPARGPIIEDLRDPNLSQMQYGVFEVSHNLPHINSIKKDRAQSRAASNRSRKAKARRDRSMSTGGSAAGPSESTTLSDPAQDSVQVRTKKPTLEFLDKAPEEDKLLLQLRKENSDEKGKGMWDNITRKFTEKTNQKAQRAALQMKLSRAVSRYGDWPQRELDILYDAFVYDDEHRYERIKARMIEMGGGQVWDWKPPHIEAQLVKMGLEEPVYDEKTKMRRKNRTAQRKRAAANARPYVHDAMGGGGTVINWIATAPQHPQHLFSAAHSHGNPYGPMPHGIDSAGRRLSTYDVNDGAGPEDGSYDNRIIDSHIYPSDQENEVIDQIHRRYGGGNSPSPMPEAHNNRSSNNNGNNAYENGNNNLNTPRPTFPSEIVMSGAANGDIAQQNRRVARQACDALLGGRMS